MFFPSNELPLVKAGRDTSHRLFAWFAVSVRLSRRFLPSEWSSFDTRLFLIVSVNTVALLGAWCVSSLVDLVTRC